MGLSSLNLLSSSAIQMYCILLVDFFFPRKLIQFEELFNITTTAHDLLCLIILIIVIHENTMIMSIFVLTVYLWCIYFRAIRSECDFWGVKVPFFNILNPQKQ